MKIAHRYWIFNNLDLLFAIAGLILGIIIISLTTIYANEYILTIGPMLVIVCGAFLLFRRKINNQQEEIREHSYIAKIAGIVFWLALACSIYVLNIEPLTRPLSYFIFTAICAAAIALQIVYSKENKVTWLILIQILLVSLSVRASAFFVFPTLPGSDPWAHLNYIQDFVNSGSITSTTGDIYYLNYPITHLNTVATYLVTGVGYKTAMFLGIGLPMIFSTIFMFLIGKELFNTKAGLLAALLVNLADTHISFGYQLIPTSIGIALFTVVLYLLVKNRRKREYIFTFLTILFMLLLVITHNMSSFVLLCCIAFLLLGVFMYNRVNADQFPGQQSSVTMSLLILTLVAVFSYWIFAGYIEGKTFFEAIVQGLSNALTERAGFLDRPSVNADIGYLPQILDIVGFVLIYGLATLGFLVWLRPRESTRTKFSLFIAATLLTAFTLIFPVFGMRNIMPSRWFAFIYVIIGLASATALLRFAMNNNKQWLPKIIMPAMVFVLCFFMITNSQTNKDSPVYSSQINERLVYKASEMAVGSWAVENYDGKIVADLQYAHRIISTHFGKDDVSYDMLNENTTVNKMVIWRDILETRPVQTPRGVSQVVGNDYLESIENTHTAVYSNNSSKALYPRSGN